MDKENEMNVSEEKGDKEVDKEEWSNEKGSGVHGEKKRKKQK